MPWPTAVPSHAGWSWPVTPEVPCQVISIFVHNSDLKKCVQYDEVGNGFDSVPFYSTETGQLLGYYSDEAANLASGDCVGVGRFSFGSQPMYGDQLSIQFTCFGNFNTITGGTGEYGCAKGYERYTYENGNVTASELHICTSLCPHTGWWGENRTNLFPQYRSGSPIVRPALTSAGIVRRTNW